MSQFAIQFNVNSYGLVPGILQVPELAVGQNVKVQLGLEKGGNVQTMSPVNLLQVAVKNNNGVYYFATQVPVHLVG
jgi:hypothetical protein